MTNRYLREVREDKGMTIIDVADAIGVARSTVYRYEAGYTDKMYLAHAIRLYRALRPKGGFERFARRILPS